MRAGAVALWLSLLLAAGCRQSPPAPLPAAGTTTLTIAAAADLKYVLDEALSAFQKQEPRIEVRTTYGSSGSFYAQLTNKAPFDLFLSADVAYPRKLGEQGLTRPGSEFVYALGNIVLWVRHDSPLDVERLEVRALLEPSVRKIAIANPQHAPYGRAAEAALRHFDVYQQVKERLVLGENIAQAAQFVESGAADAGIIALSLALAPAMKEKGRFWTIPQEAHPPLEQGGVVLSWARHPQAALELRDFLAGEEGRAIFRRYGFLLPGE